MKPASTLVSAESGSSYSSRLSPRTRSNHWTDTLTSFQKNKASLECRQAQLTNRLEILERNLPNVFLTISQSLRSGEDVPDIDLESILAESGIPACPCSPCRHPDCSKCSEYQSKVNKQSHDLQLVYDRRNVSYSDEDVEGRLCTEQSIKLAPLEEPKDRNINKCPMTCKQNPPACNRILYPDSNSVSVVTSADLVKINKIRELAKQERELKKHVEQLESRERMFIKTLKNASMLVNDPRQVHKCSSASDHPKGSTFDNPQLIRLEKLESRNKKVIEGMNDLREEKKQLVKQTEVLKNQLKDTQKKLGVVQKEVFGEDHVGCDSMDSSSRPFQEKYSCKSLMAKGQITSEDSVTLTELAKQFEEALEKVQNHGLCNLASLVKAAASTLKELSKVEEQKCLCNCKCDFTENDYPDFEETLTCNCAEWGPDELGTSGEWICKNCGGIHYSESDGTQSLSKQMPDKKINIKHFAENQEKLICYCGCGTTSVPCDCGCNDTKRKLIFPKSDDKRKSSRKPVSATSQMSCNLDCVRDCVISKSQENKINQGSSKNTLKTPDKSGMSKKQKSIECVSIDWSDVGEFDTRSVKIGVNISGTPVTLSQCSDKTVDEDKEEDYVMLLKKGKVNIMGSKSSSGAKLAHSKSLTKNWQPCVGPKKKLIYPEKKDGCHCIKIHDSGNACQYKKNGSLKDINIQKGSKLADAAFLTSCSSKSRYKSLKSTYCRSKIVMSSSSSGQGTDCFKRHDGNSCDTKIDSKARIKANQKSLKILKNKIPVQNNKDRSECEGQNPCVDCLREEKNVENNASLENPSWNSDHLCPECWAREKNHTEYPVSQNVEKLCPCGCGLSVDGENETCPCGCGKLAEFPPRKDAGFATQPKELRAPATECDCELSDNCKLCACPKDFCEGPNENVVPGSSKSFSNNVSKGAGRQQLETKHRQEIYADGNIQKKNLQKKISRCCYSNRNNFYEECSSTTTIKPTFSGLTTAVEILRAKCRNKDSMIAVLAEELRGSECIEKIVKNLAAPCLSSTAWDFDRCALYNYLTAIKVVKCEKSAASVSANTIPKPSNFKVVREICGCVLLSWEMPEDISRIKGYKIFVNGYFGAHVRSPTRTEALLDPLDISKECTLKLYAIDLEGNLSDPITIIYQSSCPGDD